jgi:hypothetical protein
MRSLIFLIVPIAVWVACGVIFYLMARRPRRHTWTLADRTVTLLISALGPLALSGYLIVSFSNWLFTRDWQKKARW